MKFKTADVLFLVTRDINKRTCDAATIAVNVGRNIDSRRVRDYTVDMLKNSRVVILDWTPGRDN